VYDFPNAPQSLRSLNLSPTQAQGILCSLTSPSSSLGFVFHRVSIVLCAVSHLTSGVGNIATDTVDTGANGLDKRASSIPRGGFAVVDCAGDEAVIRCHDGGDARISFTHFDFWRYFRLLL